MIDTSDKAVEAIAKLARDAKPFEIINLNNGKKIALFADGKTVDLQEPTADDHGFAKAPPSIICKELKLQEAQSLAEYVKRFKETGATLFADIARNRITAILDYHESPNGVKFAVHRAVLDLPFSEEWDIWAEADDDYKDQLTFARFLEENGGDIAAPSGADLLECCRDLQALRNVNFKKAVRTNTDMESCSYDEDSQLVANAASGQVEVPTRFKLQIPVYFNGKVIDMFAYLRWRLEGRTLKLAIVRSRAEHVRQAVFKSIVQEVSEAAGVQAVYGEA